jgi:UDP-N-acetylmuramyl pentapeptide phosphotransferase/UDP-N-acetylglucosamine-1-phosphate transferase
MTKITWTKLKEGYNKIPESDKKKSEVVFYGGMTIGTGLAAMTLLASSWQNQSMSSLGWGIFAVFMTLLQGKQTMDNIRQLDELRKIEDILKPKTEITGEINGNNN